jgi:hypothetical protein
MQAFFDQLPQLPGQILIDMHVAAYRILDVAGGIKRGW